MDDILRTKPATRPAVVVDTLDDEEEEPEEIREERQEEVRDSDGEGSREVDETRNDSTEVSENQ